MYNNKNYKDRKTTADLALTGSREGSEGKNIGIDGRVNVAQENARDSGGTVLAMGNVHT